MRHVVRLVRGPAVWLAVAFFFPWAWFFRSEIPPPPVYIVPTGVAESHGFTHWDPSTWVTVRDVADDGSRITIEVHQGARHHTAFQPRVWETRTAEERTPRLWTDAELEKLLSAPGWRYPALADLLSQPAGRAF